MLYTHVPPLNGANKPICLHCKYNWTGRATGN